MQKVQIITCHYYQFILFVCFHIYKKDVNLEHGAAGGQQEVNLGEETLIFAIIIVKLLLIYGHLCVIFHESNFPPFH